MGIAYVQFLLNGLSGDHGKVVRPCVPKKAKGLSKGIESVWKVALLRNHVKILLSPVIGLREEAVIHPKCSFLLAQTLVLENGAVGAHAGLVAYR